jgi:hypothetical protein
MGTLLDENSAWVKENYPEFSKALDKAEAKDKANAAKEYENKSKAENAAERKQIADVTRAERAYRKENNIPMSPKTHPGHYHMEGGPKAPSGGGGGGAGIPKVGPKRPLEMKKGGKVSSASKRADGIAIRGKTRA